MDISSAFIYTISRYIRSRFVLIHLISIKMNNTLSSLVICFPQDRGSLVSILESDSIFRLGALLSFKGSETLLWFI